MLLHVNIDERNFKELKTLFIAQGQREEFEAKLKEVADKENFDITSVQEIDQAYKMFKQSTDWRKEQCEYDIIKNICESIWIMSERYTCESCKKKLMGRYPEADRDGIVYCNSCASEKLDYCDFCNERFVKEKLTYYPDKQCYCDECLEILRK